MRLTLNRISACVVFVTLFSRHGAGGRLTDVANATEVIVVGSVDSVTTTPESAVFDVTVNRVLKGPRVYGSVHVVHPWKRPGILIGSSTSISDRHLEGVWFLRHEGPNWDAIPVHGPDGMMTSLFLPANPQPIDTSASLAMANASVTDKVGFEVAAAVRVRNAPVETLTYNARDLSSRAANSIARDFLDSSVPTVRAAGLEMLLIRSEADGIAELLREWPALNDPPSRSLVVDALRNHYRNTSPQSVASLITLAKSSTSPELQEAAILSLAQTHTKETLPFLATLLSSDDIDDQMHAIIGISSFANGCPPHTDENVASMAYMQFALPTPYRNAATVDHYAFGPVDEPTRTRLVSFWSEWWESHAVEFQGSTGSPE